MGIVYEKKYNNYFCPSNSYTRHLHFIPSECYSHGRYDICNALIHFQDRLNCYVHCTSPVLSLFKAQSITELLQSVENCKLTTIFHKANKSAAQNFDKHETFEITKVYFSNKYN